MTSLNSMEEILIPVARFIARPRPAGNHYVITVPKGFFTPNMLNDTDEYAVTIDLIPIHLVPNDIVRKRIDATFKGGGSE